MPRRPPRGAAPGHLSGGCVVVRVGLPAVSRGERLWSFMKGLEWLVNSGGGWGVMTAEGKSMLQGVEGNGEVSVGAVLGQGFWELSCIIG